MLDIFDSYGYGWLEAWWDEQIHWLSRKTEQSLFMQEMQSWEDSL